jgi:signal transduction histidine kinase
LTDFPWRTGLVGTFRTGEWAIRFFFLQNGRIRNSQLMQRILDQVAPSIHNAYLLHEMLDQAAYLEREKIARQLHDGTIQLLFGLEMQLDVLQRRAAPDAALATELRSMQKGSHQELLKGRELIQGAKTFQVTPDEFAGFVREIVEKFARDSRIKAEFVCDMAPPLPSVDQCRELARIVHETLVNIRKHSGAKNILVRFTSEFDRWRLSIEDDGKGFDFSGRLSLAELDAWHAGPAVIRDCAHRLRAHLTIQSTPNQGARLEVSLGRDIRAAFKAAGAAQASY